MQRRTRWSVGLVLLAGALLSACGPSEDTAVTEKPASVQAIKGTSLSKIVLKKQAAERLGIETAAVRSLNASRRIVPYAALIYDPEGHTSVYTNPEALTYIKQLVTVDRITGNDVIVTAGPAVGTKVVTVGATELFGIEFGIGEFE